MRKVTFGTVWVDITPAGVPAFTHGQQVLSFHTIAEAHALETDLCIVDYIALIENPPLPSHLPQSMALSDADGDNHPDPEFTNDPTVKVTIEGLNGSDPGETVDLDEDQTFASPTSYPFDGPEYFYSFDNEINETKTVYARIRSAPEPEHVVSGTITLDTIAPGAPPRPLDEGDFTLDPTLTFTWGGATDPAPGVVASYDLQVGTVPGRSDVFDGSVGAALSQTVAGPLGQTLFARVRAIDRAGNAGEWSDPSDGIFVDTPPNPPQVSVQPTAPRTLDTIAALAMTTDPDGDEIVEYRFEWFLNGHGTFEGPELGPELTVKGQSWRVSATARDDFGAWSATGHHAFTIHNTPPSQPLVDIKPQPASPDEDLIVDVQVYSVDPDGDEIGYDFNWFKSVDGGQTWVHKIELNGSPQVSHLFINEGELWQVQFTPFEVESAASALSAKVAELKGSRVEGDYGWDQVYIGENNPPTFRFDSVRAARGPGGVALDVRWTAGDADGEDYRVSIFWTDLNIAGLVNLAENLPASQNNLSAVVPLPLDRPVYLHAIITDAKGSVTQVTSPALDLTNAATPAWLTVP